MNLVVRRHSEGETQSEATYSPCNSFRYALSRIWNPGAPSVLFIMLNPSTATEVANDPTIERCERRARRLGYGAVRIANIFAYRATDPRALKRASDPIGPANQHVLHANLRRSNDILCAWGAHGDHRGQGRAVARELTSLRGKLRTFGLTKSGHPRHPLYIGYDKPLVAWDECQFASYIAAAG